MSRRITCSSDLHAAVTKTAIASLCTWCHLFGVHGGHIRATGSAGHIVWELGGRAQPCVRVDGRERLATP
jgi:hypothetical protein